MVFRIYPVGIVWIFSFLLACEQKNTMDVADSNSHLAQVGALALNLNNPGNASLPLASLPTDFFSSLATILQGTSFLQYVHSMSSTPVSPDSLWSAEEAALFSTLFAAQPTLTKESCPHINAYLARRIATGTQWIADQNERMPSCLNEATPEIQFCWDESENPTKPWALFQAFSSLFYQQLTQLNTLSLSLQTACSTFFSNSSPNMILTQMALQQALATAQAKIPATQSFTQGWDAYGAFHKSIATVQKCLASEEATQDPTALTTFQTCLRPMSQPNP